MADKSYVTLAQVAAKAGVSIGTASYALRKSACIQEATTKKVLRVAKALGYKPNSRVAALMSHIRRGRRVREGETIAFIWVDAAFGTRPYLAMFEGACLRANELGYGLIEFWRTEPGMSDKRLQQILVSRGIGGVLISPSSLRNPRIEIDWDWGVFSSAIMGTAECDHDLHRSAHHHFGGMRMTMLKLREMGKARIAAVIDKGIDERARRTWSGAFLSHNIDVGNPSEFLAQLEQAAIDEFPQRLRALCPDALISTREMIETMIVRGWVPGEQLLVTLLDWGPNPWHFGGVNQAAHVVATNAVDLVEGQLHRNEVGAPPHVKIVLSSGSWVKPCCAGEAVNVSARAV